MSTSTHACGKPNDHHQLKLGLASYSLRKFTQEKTIAMAKRAGLDYLCFKSMHLPLSATQQEREKWCEKGIGGRSEALMVPG